MEMMESHGVSMENFTGLFPHGNLMGYETETAILQYREIFFARMKFMRFHCYCLISFPYLVCFG